ncbi:MAG: hypothetical protein HWE24_19285 [Oceanospirillaceae bacterium]|nr:hypothetical protein [Oceanospirillaceae bacterium]
MGLVKSMGLKKFMALPKNMVINKSLTNRVASIWGLLEATVFFIVPDVLLTYLASKRERPLMKAIIMTTLGAFVGGLIMHGLGHTNYGLSVQLLNQIPAIDETMIATVQSMLEELGLTALFLGPMLGIPFKIFAVEAAAASFNPILFLLISIPARMLRFVLLAYAARLIATKILSSLSQRSLTLIWLVGWIGFYALYFYHFA